MRKELYLKKVWLRGTDMEYKSKSMKINSRVKVRFLGESNPVMLLHNKIYDARVLKLGWFGIVDETHEEYAYPPECFELIEEENNDNS